MYIRSDMEFEHLRAILDSRERDPKSETALLRSLVAWIKRSPSRQQYGFLLGKYVNCSYVHAMHFIKIFKNNKELLKNDFIMCFYIDGLTSKIYSMDKGMEEKVKLHLRTIEEKMFSSLGDEAVYIAESDVEVEIVEVET